MGVNKQDSRQTVHHTFLRKIANRLDFNVNAYNQLKQLLGAINAELSPAFELFPTDPLDRVLHIGPNYVPNPETSIRHVNQPINKQFPTFTTGSITLPAASGGTIVVTPTISPNPVLTITANAFIIGLVECDSLGNLSISLGTEGATEALALANFPGINSKAFQIGLLVIQTVAGAVQNVTGGRILQFSGGGGSGTGSGSGTKQPIPGYDWMEEDTFDVTTASADSKVNITAGYTNATQNLGKDLFQLSCDKSKTVNTNAGTGFTVAGGAPGFVVKPGDIIYMTSGARIDQWRRIGAVGSQTSYTLDVAFTGGNAAPGDTFMVSQAVWTKDLVNLGSPSEKTRARDQFHGNITQIAVDYYDSLIANDNIPDFVDEARIVLSASNFGLVSDSGVPSSDEFAPIFTRAPYPQMIDDYVLLGNTAGTTTIVDNTSPDTSNQALQANGNPHQALSQPFILASGATLTDFRTIVTKTGAPSGNIGVKVVKDDGAGNPSLAPADLVGSTSFSVTSLPGGISTVDVIGLSIQAIAGQIYHILFEGDAAYKASFSAAVTQVDIHANSNGAFTVGKQYDGTTFSSLGAARLLFRFLGIAEDAARLFLTYFCNPNNSDVTTSANLVGYEASFEVETDVTNGGVLDSAYGYTDGAGIPINCTISTPAGFTEMKMSWAYVPTVNPGTTAGSLTVYDDGMEIPRGVAGSTLETYYTEVADPVSGIYNTIRLNADYSALNRSLEVIRSEGIVDTSNSNTTRIAVLEAGTIPHVVFTSVNYTVQPEDDIVLADPNGGPITITLPDATISRKKVQIVKFTTGTANVTVAPSLAQTFDQGTYSSFILTCPQDSIDIVPTTVLAFSSWKILNTELAPILGERYIGSNQVISNATVTQINFPGSVAHNTTTSGNAIVIFYGGYYDISGNIRWQPNGAGTRQIDILVNGAIFAGSSQLGTPDGDDQTQTAHCGNILLAPGDVVTLNCYQNSSGSLTLLAPNSRSNRISCRRVNSVNMP